METPMKDILKLNEPRHWKLVGIATAISWPFMMFVLFLSYKSGCLQHSDGTHQQLIVEAWLRYKEIIVTCGQDSFVLKYPFYFFLHLLSDNSPIVLLFTEATFLTIMLFLFHYFQFFAHRNLALGVGVSLLFCMHGGLIHNQANPNTRNMELPLAMLCSWVILHYFLKDEVKKNKISFILLTLFIILQVISDGYVLMIYATIFPTYFVLGGLASKKIKNYKQNLLSIFIYICVLFLSLKLGLYLITKINIIPRELPIYINLKKAFFHDIPKMHQDFTQLLDNFICLASGPRNSLVTGCFYFLFFLILGQLYVKKEKFLQSLKNLEISSIFTLFSFFMIIVNIGIFYTIGAREDDSKYRYLMLVPYALLLFVVGVEGMLGKLKRIVFGVIIILICYYSYILMNSISFLSKTDELFDKNIKIQNFTKENNVFLGFADYWDSGMLNYYANGKLLAYPVFCPGSFQIDPTVLAHPRIETIMKYGIPYFIYINNPHSHCSLDFIRNTFAGKILKEEIYGPSEAIFLINNI